MSDTVSLREHFEALRLADARLAEANDRRYTEVGAARAEALKIKEAGDAKALVLAAEIQSYRDEQDNRLREQINSERNLYVTRIEQTALEDKIVALIKPLSDYVTAQTGQVKGIGQSWKALVAAAALAATIGALVPNLQLGGTTPVTVENEPHEPVPVEEPQP